MALSNQFFVTMAYVIDFPWDDFWALAWALAFWGIDMPGFAEGQYVLCEIWLWFGLRF